MNVLQKLLLNGQICIITGGAGLLGVSYAEAVLEAGGIPILVDMSKEKLEIAARKLKNACDVREENEMECYVADITNESELCKIREFILEKYGHIDILINNAANNPKVEDNLCSYNRFENFDEQYWENDLSVGLKGAFLCSKVFGSVMANQGKGVILNISSDLGLIAPDQRLYKKAGLAEEQQPKKPVTYSVIKHGLIGLTKYLATYWAMDGVRANAICPGGVFAGQNEEFIKKLTNLIPMGRMARKDEYKAAVLFLISDASEYMTGAVISMDGGRTCW